MNFHLLYGIPFDRSGSAFYATLAGIGIELLILDFFVVLFGKFDTMRKWFSVRGYYFDYNFESDWKKLIDHE